MITCPHCHHQIRANAEGIKPKIIELIRDHPGIIAKEIAKIIYNDDAMPTVMLVRVHISQINRKVYTIRDSVGGRTHGGYFLA